MRNKDATEQLRSASRRRTARALPSMPQLEYAAATMIGTHRTTTPCRIIVIAT